MNTTQRLEAAISKQLSPIDFAHQRETILRQGLGNLVAKYGHDINIAHFDSNAEILLETKKPFGKELTEILNTIPVRHGIQFIQGHIQPNNTWCRINHFDLEALLKQQDAKECAEA